MTEQSDPLAWSRDYTPVLRSLADEHRDERPLDGYTVAVASYLETKTGVFVETLQAAGAEVLVTGSEPHSTVADPGLGPGLYDVPDRLDRALAERKLETMGVAIDDLTDRQREYYEDWEHPDSAF